VPSSVAELAFVRDHPSASRHLDQARKVRDGGLDAVLVLYQLNGLGLSYSRATSFVRWSSTYVQLPIPGLTHTGSTFRAERDFGQSVLPRHEGRHACPKMLKVRTQSRLALPHGSSGSSDIIGSYIPIAPMIE
jgi:hypothetical protein